MECLWAGSGAVAVQGAGAQQPAAPDGPAGRSRGAAPAPGKPDCERLLWARPTAAFGSLAPCFSVCFPWAWLLLLLPASPATAPSQGALQLSPAALQDFSCVSFSISLKLLFIEIKKLFAFLWSHGSTTDPLADYGASRQGASFFLFAAV